MSASPDRPAAAFEPDAAAAASELAALFARYRGEGRNDAAWCVARTGTLLVGERTPAHVAEFAAKFRPTRPRRAGRALDDAAWLHHVYHRDDDPYVGKVFESVLAPLRRVRAQPVQKFGFSTRDALSPSSSSIALVRALGAAAFTLNVPTPLIFLRPDRPGAITLVPSEPIASVAGEQVVTGRSVDELAFLAGHHMSSYRPDHYVRGLYAQTPELTTLFLAVLKIGRRELRVPGAVDRVVEQLELLVGNDVSCSALVRRVATLFVERGESADMARWVAGTERTALRAGLLMAGDIDVARRCIGLIPGAPADAMADLTAWSMSEDFFALRQRTGMALWPDDETPPAVHGGSDATPSIAPPADNARPTLPPPDVLESLRPMLGDLRTVEISLEELEAHATVVTQAVPSDDVTPSALRSVEIPLDELERGPDADTARIGFDGLFASQHPLADAYNHHLVAGSIDRAYYVAAVWVRRDGEMAPRPIRELYDSRRSRASAPPQGRLGDVDWSHALADPGERTAVGRLLAALVGPMRAAQPRTPEDYGYQRANALGDGDGTARALTVAAMALGVTPPLVFADEQFPGVFGRPPCEPAITVFNPKRAHEVVDRERDFVAGEHVAYLRPERQARVLARSPSLLTQLVRAVVDAFARGSVPSVDEPFVAATLHELARDDAALAAARGHVASIVDPSTVDEQVIAWCEATERTAARAALLLAFDFDVASRALRRQRGAPALLPADTKLAALEDFVAGDDFATLRARLGLDR